jgi:hemerythrin-like domain-containing protein
MTDAITVLRKDHDEVKRMLAELERGPVAATGADKNQLQLRKNMTEQLIIEESKHEAVEEEYFWPAVRKHVADGDRLADKAVGQEQEAKHVLDRLDKLDPGAPEFEALLQQFTKAGREHIEFEETQVWPSLQATLSAQEMADLGTQLEQGKKIAPTRPHPNIPPVPGVLKAAGPATAAADRLRDAATGRDSA